MGTIRVVLDTNVLVSALGFGGPPLDALLATFEDDVRLFASDATLDELDRVMQYERLPFTSAERTQFLTILRNEATLVEPDTAVDIVRDADDDKFLEVALEANADYVVSGDEDLLDLESYDEIEFVSPDGFTAFVD